VFSKKYIKNSEATQAIERFFIQTLKGLKAFKRAAIMQAYRPLR
jgi:hypothetical protein